MNAVDRIPAGNKESPPADMRWIPGGTFRMGSDKHYPEERPAHDVGVHGFWIDIAPVTNRKFASFVAATGYITVAERTPDARDYPGAKPEMLRPGSLVFTPPRHPVDLADWTQWWSFVFGADWRHPYGPQSSLEGLDDHPVVQVAWPDVEAYAAWAGKSLPTEAEWEFAARGGLDGAEYAWGEEFMPGGQRMANTWIGTFPSESGKRGRRKRTTAVGSYPPNGHGLSDMIGNVWEWTSDWYDARHQADPARSCCIPQNPLGAGEDRSYDPRQPSIRIPRKVVKGGSHLCAPNYCRRYRPAARHAQPIDSAMTHVGFRCVLREAGAA